jgi:hypothetical protein
MTSGEPTGAGQLGGAGPSIQASVGNMLSAANAGGFAISETAGRKLLDAIHQMQQTLGEYRSGLGTIDQEPQLGSSPGATVTKPFVRQVANGDQQSFIPVLEQFGQSLEQAADAIARAMRNYQGTEAGRAAEFRGLS